MTRVPDKCIILDTNLFLHYTRPDQLDWSRLCSRNIELVIPAVVVRELEKAKNFGATSRVRSRAAEMVAWLSKLMDEGFEVVLREGLRLRFEANEPSINFSEHSLVRDLQDDVLIAALLSLAATVRERPMIATADLGVKSKARQRGFEVFSPHESEKLADELDARDKELLELRKENQQYKNRQPKLKVMFGNDETHLKITPTGLPSLPEPLTLDELKRLHPLAHNNGGKTGLPAYYQLSSVLSATPESHLKRYNDELRTFYEKYEKYRNRILRLRVLAQLRLELPIVVSNVGTAPATYIDVVLTFPEGSGVLKDLKLFEVPKAPTPPERPTSGLIGSSLFEHGHLGLLDHLSFSPPAGIFPRPILNWSLEVKANTAHFRLDRLKPEFSWKLPPLWLQFPTAEALRSTTVNVDVSAAESTGRARQKLSIVIA